MNIPSSYIDATTEEARRFNEQEESPNYTKRRAFVGLLIATTALVGISNASDAMATEYCVSTSTIASGPDFESNLATALREKGATVSDLGQLDDIPSNQAVDACIDNSGLGIVGNALDTVLPPMAHVGTNKG